MCRSFLIEADGLSFVFLHSVAHHEKIRITAHCLGVLALDTLIIVFDGGRIIMDIFIDLPQHEACHRIAEHRQTDQVLHNIRIVISAGQFQRTGCRPLLNDVKSFHAFQRIFRFAVKEPLLCHLFQTVPCIGTVKE